MIVKFSRISSLEVLGSSQRIWKKKVLVLNHGFLTHPSGETTTKDGYNAYIDFFGVTMIQIWKVYELSGFRILEYKLHQVGGKKNIMRTLFCVFRMAGVHEGPSIELIRADEGCR